MDSSSVKVNTKRNPGALWQGQNISLGSSAGFPDVELSWFLRLCRRTQSAPVCAMEGQTERSGTFIEVFISKLSLSEITFTVYMIL